VLVLEISLTRIFSYTVWHHFTYVTISLAMLGFGASGAILASSEKLGNLGTRLMHKSALIGGISVPVMLVVISKVPFHPTDVFEEPIQVLYMAVYYLFVTIPFFCAGLTISCAFKSLPQDATRIYFWDLVGAGLGCLAVVTAIRLFGVPSVATLSGGIFLLATVAFLGRGSRLWKITLVAAAIVWIPLAANVEKALEFNPSKEKWISMMPDKTVTFSKWSPIFRVDAYDLTDDRIYRMGDMSLYGIPTKHLPADVRYANIAHDGDGLALMIESDTELSTYDAFDRSLLKAPYLLNESPAVLIIGAGGGVDVGMALYNDARSVLAVELDPITVDLVSNKYADFVGRLYDRPNVRVVADEGRSFLRRSDEKFDLIQMTGVDTLAALNSGAYVLAENYLYTTDAYMDFMDHLNPDGLLSIAIFDFHHASWFPRYTVKQMSVAIDALEKKGIEDYYKHIAVISSSEKGYPMVLILTKMSPFTREEIGKLDQLAKEVPFDVWHMPGTRLDNPCSSLIHMQPDQREKFYRMHRLRLRAPTDNSPFFFSSFKWIPLIREPLRTRSAGVATGQLILLLILVFSFVFSIALIIFPLFKFRRVGLQAKYKWNYILYFAALGLGFIFLEISYIQRFILFLGYPTYSLTVILFSLLTFSGIGSYISGKLSLAPRNLIVAAVCLLAIIALSYLVVLPPIFNYFLGALRHVRIAVSLVLLFPLGVLMGMFFPTGIRIISVNDDRFIPWAWGINGCASVIGTVLSIIIAMSHGFNAVTILSVIIYAVGIAAMYRACGEGSVKTA
jgi:spermidine synthase